MALRSFLSLPAAGAEGEEEAAPTADPASNQQGKSKETKKEQKSKKKTFSLLPRGFANAGNTCFMAATLQALLATRAVSGLAADAARLVASPPPSGPPPTAALRPLLRSRAPVLSGLAELASQLLDDGGGEEEEEAQEDEEREEAKGATREGGEKRGRSRKSRAKKKKGSTAEATSSVPGFPPSSSSSSSSALPPLPLPGKLAELTLGGGALSLECMFPSLARFGGRSGRTGAAAVAASRAAAAAAEAARLRASKPFASSSAPPSTASSQGPSSQEDAQEYLTHLLDSLHQELVGLRRAVEEAEGGEERRRQREGGDGGSGAPAAAAIAAAEEAAPDGGNDKEEEEDSWITAGRTRRSSAVTRVSGTARSQQQQRSAGGGGGGGGATTAVAPTSSSPLLAPPPPLSRIAAAVGGALRSEVRARGFPASATLQPFTVLSLDVSSLSGRVGGGEEWGGGAPSPSSSSFAPPPRVSLEEALDAFVRPERLEGYRPKVAGAGAGAGAGAARRQTATAAPRAAAAPSSPSRSPSVPATKSLSVVANPSPPSLLVLHLMRFAFDATTGSSGKLHARVQFPLFLRMKPSWLSFSSVSPSLGGQSSRTHQTPKREYRLVATVSHHGRGAAHGHYTAAVRLRDEREEAAAKAKEEEEEAKGGRQRKKQPADNKRGVSFRSPLVEAGRLQPSGASSSSRWLSFDDDRVREVCEDEVTDGGAYLLFYELV